LKQVASGFHSTVAVVAVGSVGQSERLAYTLGFRLGLRAVRPALADGCQASTWQTITAWPSPPPASRRRLPKR